eukprot:gene10520-3991_t
MWGWVRVGALLLADGGGHFVRTPYGRAGAYFLRAQRVAALEGAPAGAGTSGGPTALRASRRDSQGAADRPP